MSSRGGRGGRGGKGYTPSGGAQVYLKRSAKEAGLDAKNLSSLSEPSTLFPDLKWHSNGSIWKPEEDDELNMAPPATKRTASKVYMIQKGREVRSRMQALYQVQPSSQEQDVKRYQAKEQEKESHSMTNVSAAAKRLGPSFVPQELLQLPAKKRRATSAPASTSNKKEEGPTNLKKLEEKETKQSVNDERDNDAADVDESIEQQSEDEEEEAADYTMNYYESEGEESDTGGGDGGEPTF